MTRKTTIINCLIKRKIATAILIMASMAAFATLGDGGKNDRRAIGSTERLTSRNFSIRSQYNYRGNNLFSTQKSNKYITLNTVVTYQKGNATYVVPLKKKVMLDKVTFKPSR
jgi:hypothetical protein